MAQIVRNECVDCGLPCLGDSCLYMNVTRFYCDKCKEETTLYEYDGQELCANCLLDVVPKVEGSGD